MPECVNLYYNRIRGKMAAAIIAFRGTGTIQVGAYHLKYVGHPRRALRKTKKTGMIFREKLTPAWGAVLVE